MYDKIIRQEFSRHLDVLSVIYMMINVKMIMFYRKFLHLITTLRNRHLRGAYSIGNFSSVTYPSASSESILAGLPDSVSIKIHRELA